MNKILFDFHNHNNTNKSGFGKTKNDALEQQSCKRYRSFLILNFNFLTYFSTIRLQKNMKIMSFLSQYR